MFLLQESRNCRGGSKKFHIDHYKPKIKFPKSINDYINLFYCCSDCNNSKKDFWPTLFDRFLNRFILNPCEHDFEEHYDMNQPEWRGSTQVALWHIEKLRLNSKKRIQFRQDELYVHQIIDELNRKQQELEKLLVNNELSKKARIAFENNRSANQKQIDILKRKTLEPLE